MNRSVKSRGNRCQGGFVLTVELLLIITVLVLGSIVGLVAIRDALLEQQRLNADRSVTLSDSNEQPLGPMVGFDEHEAPLLFYFDRTLFAADNTQPVYRALIGVRDDRFTSREPIYYTGLNCQGTPCIKRTSSEQSYGSATVSEVNEVKCQGGPCIDKNITDTIDGTTVEDESLNDDAVSYFHAVQNGPNYAIGMNNDGSVKGALYRESLDACPVDLISGIIGSRYMSQRLVRNSPCESPFVFPQLLDNQLAEAVPVLDINDPNQNALDAYTPPFKVNMPTRALSSSSSWERTPPKAEQ